MQKLKKVVRIVLDGPAINQSDCRKAGPYQLPLITLETKELHQVSPELGPSPSHGNTAPPLSHVIKSYVRSRNLSQELLGR